MSQGVQQLEQLETYLESFESSRSDSARNDHKWLRKLREDAFARFSEAGFPTTRDGRLAFHECFCDRADPLPARTERT